MVMIDDIIIFGRDMREHDSRLNRVLEQLRKSQLTINQLKSLYRVGELEFLGFHISRTGCRPTEEKIKALRTFRQPTSAEEIGSFLGLVGFVGSFIFKLSDRTTALRAAMKAPFVWGKEQQHEENGQIGPRIIAFASKSLTEVEKRYAQTHREALAVTWGIICR